MPCLLHDLARPRNLRALRLYGKEHPLVSHHPAEFPGHKPCGIEYMMILVCRVISQHHVTKGMSNFMFWSHSNIHPSCVRSSVFSLSCDLTRPCN